MLIDFSGIRVVCPGGVWMEIGSPLEVEGENSEWGAGGGGGLPNSDERSHD